MKFEFYGYGDYAELEASFLGMSFTISYGSKIVVEAGITGYAFRVPAEKMMNFSRFVGYVRDLAELHPSPSWPEEVNQVWFEYVNWKRGLDVSENQ